MPSKLCSPHQPKKLSISAIQPIIAISQFTHTILYWGAQGPSHQNANANRKILSNLPKFCFSVFASFYFNSVLNQLQITAVIFLAPLLAFFCCLFIFVRKPAFFANMVLLAISDYLIYHSILSK